MKLEFRATTIVAVKRDGVVAMAGDGQVTVNETVMKGTARKVQRMYNGTVLAGYAGGAADALTLFERFEAKIDEFHGNLPRAAHELAKEWRTDRALRRLEALMVVADKQNILVVSGNGDLVRPDSDVVGIGSGGAYALAAARALLEHSSLPAPDIAAEAVRIAASICVYTNDQITLEVLE